MSAIALAHPVVPAAVIERRTPTGLERRLAAGLRLGDPKALEGVHAEYGATIFGYLRNTLGDRGAAEDVFQLVLTELWRRGAQYDPTRGSLLTWAMTIARSRAIDELRRRRPEPNEALVARLTDAASSDPGPDDLADRWRVAHLLGLLPADEAEVLRLRFYDELSQSEIAALTGVALGTVKGRMVRALERLRELMDAEDERLAHRLSPGSVLAEVRA